MQAVPLSARKAAGGSAEGTASFLQLPYFNEAIIKKIARKVSCIFYCCHKGLFCSSVSFILE